MQRSDRQPPVRACLGREIARGAATWRGCWRACAGRAVVLLLCAGVCAGALACSRAISPLGLSAGDLLVLDADAGVVLPAGSGAAPGERAGLLFVARARRDNSFAPPVVFARDTRWVEPVALAQLPDGSLLVLDSAFAPDPDAPARGAIFRLLASDLPPRLWWSDARLRQPVALARGHDGTLYVSDRAADPLDLQQPTGAVFAVPVTRDGRAGTATVVAAGPELVTPGALLACADGRLLVLDADANPHGLRDADGRLATPGVLYEIRDTGLHALLEPSQTTSPIALLEPRPGLWYLLDANHGSAPGHLGDGALFRVGATELELVLDTLPPRRARDLVDPAGLDWLADGRLVVADANADPLGHGADGTGKGVYGTGPGAVLVVDPVAAQLAPLLTGPGFVTPVAVLRVRALHELSR